MWPYLQHKMTPGRKYIILGYWQYHNNGQNRRISIQDEADDKPLCVNLFIQLSSYRNLKSKIME